MNKIVALATKPKRAAPKAKYIDPIIQATFNQDGSIQEIVRTLSVRLRDPNTSVAFKSLIVLHQMLRSGALEPTFSYLASSSLASQLSSHEAPNIAAYGHYLASRIKSYANLKRDIIRDKSDRRNTNRLRTLGVEGGLLRETREVQRMIATLVESKFYSDDIDDEVSMTALRFLVKDLLVLFTAVNEGVINVLEHYFEMSHPDASTALKIYKTFCRDTEKVVAYLGIAKKLQHVTHIPIPNLKHAPVSLVSSLEEYLNDPNFERNREEYKENKRIADGKAPKSTSKSGETPATTSTATPTSAAAPSTSTATSEGAKAPTSFTDFFESIEQSQTAMFDPQTGSPTLGYFQQQAAFNPFMAQQMTGAPSQFGMVQPQMTGFVAPNPFMQPQMTGFVQPQMTGFVQPQMTGMAANPFRQSMMPTGQSPFGAVAGGQPQQQLQPMMMQPHMTGSPFIGQGSSPFVQTQATGAGPFGNGNRPMSMMPQATGNAFGRPTSPFGQQTAVSQAPPTSSSFAPPQRVASPFGNISSPPAARASSAPLQAQKTGARNPFAPAPGSVPPPKAPQGPSMNQMAFNTFQQQQQPQQTGASNGFDPNGFGGSAFQSQPQQQQQQQQPSQSTDAFSSVFGNGSSASPAPLTQTKTGLMGNVASDFAFSPSSNTSSAPSPSTFNPSSSPFTSTSTFTPPTTFSSTFTPSSPLTSQPTGFGGSSMRPFQPTSSFGSQLADELGPAPRSQFQSSIPSQTPGQNGSSAIQSTNSFSNTSQPPSSSMFGSANPVTGSSTGVGAIQPQSTGFNPFRGSTLPPLNTPLSAQMTGFQPKSAFGASLVSGTNGGQQQPPQQQQNGGGAGSLI